MSSVTNPAEETMAAVAALLRDDRKTVKDSIEAGFKGRLPERLYDLAAEYPRRGGKGLRPSLCLAACRMFGGVSDDALDVAAAIELLHTAFLILDDIQDDSSLRRGQATLHRERGARAAISAAGALVALAMERVVETGRRFPTLASALMAEFAHLFRRTHEGQWTEIEWIDQGRLDLQVVDYLAMVQDKTCWYTAVHPLRLGALIGSRGRADLDRLTPFGFYLGALLQLQDDLENLVRESGSYQKDLGADLVEGKRTLPIIYLLQDASQEDRREVLAILGPDGRGDASDRLERALVLMRKYGSLDRAENFANSIVGVALTEGRYAFEEAQPGPDRRALLGFVAVVRGLLPAP